MSTFETERLHVRPLCCDDVDLVYRLMGDPRVFFWRPQPVERVEAERFVAAKLPLGLRGLGWWIVTRRDAVEGEDDFVGQVGLQPLGDTEEIELGYSLAPAVWGCGYATEAAGRLLRQGFEAVGVDQVAAVVLPENDRSLAVLHRLGFTERGERLHAGVTHRYLEVTKAEFAASCRAGK